MAHLIRLEKGGVTLDLNSGAYRTLGYVPASPGLSTTDAISEIEDGGERFLTTRRNVTETAEIIFRPYVGSSMSDIEAAVQTLELWLMMAEEHQNSGAGSPVYIEFQPHGTSAVYRSEILSGKVDFDTDAMSTWVSGKKAKATLIFTRRFYWEGPEAEIRLTNGNGSNVTGGLTIYNHDDADTGDDNYVELNGNDISGGLPAAIRLEITNNYNSATRSNVFYVGLNNFSGMTLQHVLEGEGVSYGGSAATPSAFYSGGNARTFNLTGSLSLLGAWVLDSSMLAQYRGRFYKVLARFGSGLSSNYVFQLVIKFPSGSYLTTVAETQEVKFNNSIPIQELGSIQIPPWLTQESSLYPVDLCLYGYSLTGSGSVTLDNLFLMPLDGYRVLMPKGYGLAYQARLVDDGIGNVIYTDGWGTPGKTGHYLGFGDRFLVWPKTTARLYFVVTNQTSGAEIARSNSIRVFYRPRRLTI